MRAAMSLSHERVTPKRFNAVPFDLDREGEIGA
jgi:hypothetical protein